MRFTYDEALEASEAGEPIMLNRADIKRLCEDNGGTPQSDTYFERFYNENPFIGDSLIDAAQVLAWLGY